jgi:hypothetical protein
MMEQMAQSQDPKRRAKQDGHDATEASIDSAVGMKQIVNRFVDQAPKRIGQERQWE